MTLRALALCSALALLAACSRDTSHAPHSTPAGPSPTSAVESLDSIDTRKPVPLSPTMALHQKEEMRDHLLAVQEIVLALAADDLAAAESAAGRIGFSDETTEMCAHMGAAASGFSEQALAFHRTADRIVVAARERDRARVLSELGATLDACTSCHATWKQQIVDEATWQSLTSASPAAVHDASH